MWGAPLTVKAFKMLGKMFAMTNIFTWKVSLFVKSMTIVKEIQKMLMINSLNWGYYLTVAVSLVILLPEIIFTLT